jgi:hypothetical protein
MMIRILFFIIVPACLCFAQDSAKAYTELKDFPSFTLIGRVVLKSAAPALPQRLAVTADVEACGKSVVNRSLLLSRDRGIQNVILCLEGVASGKPVILEKSVLISDEKCDFYPKVVAVQQGQAVTFRNGDRIYNDFRAVLKTQVVFNIALPMAGQSFTKKMNRCGLMDLYCNVHPWEHACVLVSPHPYFAVSGPDESFRMEQVPRGRLVLSAVHEVLGKKSVEIAEGRDTVLVEF